MVDRCEREEAQGLVRDIVEAVAERRRAALGLDDCLWAGTLAAIDRLAVQQSASKPGVICYRSGWLALSGETCPLCGEPTRPTGDIIDDLVGAVIDDGGTGGARGHRHRPAPARGGCAAASPSAANAVGVTARQPLGDGAGTLNASERLSGRGGITKK
jgi:hypothetical protein